MGIKQSAKCSYCAEESKSINRLFIDYNIFQQLFKCFEKHYKLHDKLTDLEILSNSVQTKLIKKRLGIK